MKEGAMINKSLLALANCINSLTSDDSDNKHVPFRDSKLTRLLKHVLRQDASTKTIMIACVWYFKKQRRDFKYFDVCQKMYGDQ